MQERSASSKHISLIDIQFYVALGILLLVSILSLRNINLFLDVTKHRAHSNAIIQQFQVLVKLMVDAETGQRGYIITGEEEYLEPYKTALPKVEIIFRQLKSLTADNPFHQHKLEAAGVMIGEKLSALNYRVDLRRNAGLEAAIEAVRNGKDKPVMDKIRAIISEMEWREHNLLANREVKAQEQSQVTIVSTLIGTMMSLGLFVAAFMMLRQENHKRRLAEKTVGELNGQLEAHVLRLEEANKELDSFTYTVSHDLRAPLRAIDGFSRLLLEECNDQLNDEGKRLLNIVRKNTVNMGQLIDDLLTFCRLGRQEINWVPMDLEKLARSIFDELKANYREKSPQFNVKGLPSSMGDLRLMRQVLVNLLSNALKYSKTREHQVIEMGGDTKPEENIYYVKDNGVGFEMQYVDKLFGVFQRLHTDVRFEGTGVGLAIVRRIINRHGGRVWAESKVNEGSSFYFSLPKKGAVNG